MHGVAYAVIAALATLGMLSIYDRSALYLIHGRKRMQSYCDKCGRIDVPPPGTPARAEFLRKLEQEEAASPDSATHGKSSR